ncbi:MAG: RNA-binding S4 domain-containing protein [Bacteroidales bacterium]|nr:RNA-binding S4 domain-containing protein [Bacteroidales bacterium]MCF8391992.1 RNA-binding S4 domain-containing protein [Bacteroidales bacterium]
MNNELRADKFLWAVRIFKTRAIAAEACKKGKVQISGMNIKASREIKPGECIEVRKAPVNYSYQVISIPNNRVSAKLVPDFIVDKTSEEELLKLTAGDSFFIKRDRGTGRPTKKDRRIIDNLRAD